MSRVKDKDLLLVGSMPFDTAEHTFRWACDGGLAPALPCLPDGEIGERSYWIIMLGYRVYHGHPQIETLRRPNPVDGSRKLETERPARQLVIQGERGRISRAVRRPGLAARLCPRRDQFLFCISGAA
jgi:hypothetical protein